MGWDRWNKWNRWNRQGGGVRTWISKNALLYDTFKTADAAPITSPRTCEPGPGTLDINDPSNHISISADNLVIDGGASVYANPGICTSGVTPGDGVAFFLNLSAVGATRYGRYGWSASDNASADSVQATSYPHIFCGVSVSPQQWLDTDGGKNIIPHVDGSKYLQILRGGLRGMFAVVNGELVWVNERVSAFGATVYAKIIGHTVAPSISEIALLPLASYNAAWGGDWSEVTDTKTNPATTTTFNCEADCSINKTWTHEVGKYTTVRFRGSSATNHIGIQDYNNTFSVFKITGGSFSSLWTGSAMTDGVSYEADIVASGSSIKVYLDKVLKANITETDHQSVSGGLVLTDLATNDIVITTHPYPALGIATSRVVCPQDGDSGTHDPDCMVEIKNITLPPGGTDALNLRYVNADPKTVQLIFRDDGSVDLYAYPGGYLVNTGGGTASDGDDVVVVLDGANAEVFVNGSSIGASSSAPHLTATAFNCEFNSGFTCDHIACFPRDVSSLLPKGTF